MRANASLVGNVAIWRNIGGKLKRNVMQILIYGLDVWNPTTKTNLDNMTIVCHCNEIKSLISPTKLHAHLRCIMARRSWMILLVYVHFNHCFIMALSSYFMGIARDIESCPLHVQREQTYLCSIHDLEVCIRCDLW